MINVVLVDDHNLVRSGIKRILEEVPGIKVVGEARSGEEACKIVKSLNPDVVLMDIQLPLPGMNGLEAMRQLLDFNPDLKVIIVTVYNNDLFPTKFLKEGALGYLTKGSDMKDMIQAIRSVHAGQRYISSEIANQIALKNLGDANEFLFDELSERELQVMLMVAKAIKPPQIAQKLRLSPKTVNSYRYRIFVKLGIKNDVSLTHLAIRHGFIEGDNTDQ